LRILRDGKELEQTVVLGKLGDSQSASTDAEGVSTPNRDAEGNWTIENIGVKLADLTDKTRQQLDLARGTKGVVITGILPGSPAQAKGLQEGMLVLQYIGPDRVPRDVVNAKDLAQALAQVKEGTTIALKVRDELNVWLVGLRVRETKK
jgi:serine protease Do